MSITELFVEGVAECGNIVAKAANNAIVRGGKLGRRSLEMYPALIEQGDAIAGGERLGNIVRHHHGSEIKFLPVADDHLENGVASRRVQPGRWLVEKHQFGTSDQRPGEGEAFLHSAGHLRRKMICKLIQSETFQCVASGLRDLAAA